jgi:hypothetical protein
MWNLTLGYGTQKTIHSPTCYGPAGAVFFLEWQVFAIWSEIVFKNTKKRFLESFFNHSLR